jgi:hypothetical protein
MPFNVFQDWICTSVNFCGGVLPVLLQLSKFGFSAVCCLRGET